MENYTIDRAYAILASIDTMGSQTKFHKDGYWYKCDSLGMEGLAEEVTSMLLSCSNIKDYVTYERCTINGKKGCRSRDFLNTHEQFITFDTLYRNMTGRSLSDKMGELQNADARLHYLIDFIQKATELDATAYLYKNLALDMITRNPDRHFNNLGIILQADGTFRFAPIFDNGQGLMMNFNITPPILEDEEKEERLCAATVSGSFEAQFVAIDKLYHGPKLMIDTDKLNVLLKGRYPTGNIAVDYLKASINYYKGLFSEKQLLQENEIDDDMGR